MIRCWVLSFVLSLFGTASFGAPASDAYGVALHLQQCLKRPVLFGLQIARQLATDAPPCEKEPLANWLKSRGLEAIWGDKVLYLRRVPAGMAPGLPPPLEQRWSKIALDLSIRNPTNDETSQREDFPEDYKYIPERRNLAPEELKRAGEWILENVPMPPTQVQYCQTCGLPADTARAKLEIVLEAVKLSRDGSERIIGWIASPDSSRLLVGQLAGARLEIEWMSVLLDSYGQVLIYRDVNGDGIGEIWSLSAYFAGSQQAVKLSIFDAHGKELTREAGECDMGVQFAGPPEENKPLPAACPITGYPAIEHSLDPESGKVELTAHREFRGDDAEPDRIYEFVNGEYVWKNRAADAAELHRLADQAFGNRQYDSAAWNFEKAAKLDPQSAQYANDAGFARYKLGQYELAVAVAWLKKALAADPKRAVAYLNLGDACVKLSRNAEAREAYQRYLTLAPNARAFPLIM
ncbi:MAG: tetratricopeptide repeat protein [Candidatus Acidiferrum sp.]